MQAITTKYIGPTNHRGARIKARTQTRSVTIPYPYELSVYAAHMAAAAALADGADLLGGALPDDTGYAFILQECNK